MKLTATIVAAAALAAGASAMSFEAFKALHGKSYSKGEESARKAIYNMNLKAIQAHNANPEATFTMAANQFADLTQEEFAAAFIGGWRGPTKRVNQVATEHLRANVESLPASIDWVSKGAVTPVKNQEQCGSCWAFSTTGSVEGANYVKNGKLVSLSEQQLVDCSGSAGNQGCNGGLMDNAFSWIVSNGGICTEESYPYTGADGSCKKCTPAVKLSGYKDVPTDSDSAMMSALAQQPVSIAIEADQMSFQFYSGGVMTGSCGTNLDHGVLAVGYGSLNGQDYYKVKNSWGASWGMSGYILLGRGSSYNGGKGQCGMLSVPSYPTAQ